MILNQRDTFQIHVDFSYCFRTDKTLSASSSCSASSSSSSCVIAALAFWWLLQHSRNAAWKHTLFSVSSRHFCADHIRGLKPPWLLLTLGIQTLLAGNPLKMDMRIVRFSIDCGFSIEHVWQPAGMYTCSFIVSSLCSLYPLLSMRKLQICDPQIRPYFAGSD